MLFLASVVAHPAGSARKSIPAMKKESMMATLVIDLQDGFSADTVSIHVNGKEIYHKQGVNTDLSISRADSVQTQVPAGATNITISVPSKHLSKTVTHEVATTLYLGVSIHGGVLEVQPSNEQFFYM
jgi:hypothetical protein